MNGKVRHKSTWRNLEQKNGMSHDNMTSSSNSSTTTIQPGSSDSELCRLMSSGRSLESLADDGEEWVPEIGGEPYEQMVINRGTAQMNSPTEAGETSVDEPAEFEDETEDYGLVIEKHFQQLYGFKTPYNHCFLDDEWCNQVLKQNANGSFSWSDFQPFNATAQEQFTNQHFPNTTETEMASLSSFLQVSNNKINEHNYKTRQEWTESDNDEIPGKYRTSQTPKVSTYEIPDSHATSEKSIEMSQLHEVDDDIRNDVAQEIMLSDSLLNHGTGSETSLRVEINSQSAIDEWTATSDSPSQQDSAQFALCGSKPLNSSLEYGADTTEHKQTEDVPADTTEDDVPDQVLPINEWPVNGELNDHPLKFLYLINELALMNDFVVVSNLVDTCPFTDNGRFAPGMVRADRCTIEEINSDDDTERSTYVSPAAANNHVKDLIKEVSGKRPAEKQEAETCEYARFVTKGREDNVPKSSPKRPEVYEDVSYSEELLKKACSQVLSGQENTTSSSVQGQQVPGNNGDKIISNMLRNEHKNTISPKNETASIPQIADNEKTRKSKIPRWKSVELALCGKPPRHPSYRMIQTTEDKLRQTNTKDLACEDESETMLLSKNSRKPCDNRKTTQLQLTDQGGYRKHDTGLRSNKSENDISSTLLDGQQSHSSCAPAQEHQTDDLKLPPVRTNRHERESGSYVTPPNRKAANEYTQDLFEINKLKSKGYLKNKHQQIRGHFLAKLTAIPSRKQQTSSTVIKLPSLSLQPTPIHKQSHPLAIRRPYTPPNRNVLEARAQWPQFYTSHPVDLERGLPRRMALKDLPSLKKVPGFSYGVYE